MQRNSTSIEQSKTVCVRDNQEPWWCWAPHIFQLQQVPLTSHFTRNRGRCPFLVMASLGSSVMTLSGGSHILRVLGIVADFDISGVWISLMCSSAIWHHRVQEHAECLNNPQLWMIFLSSPVLTQLIGAVSWVLSKWKDCEIKKQESIFLVFLRAEYVVSRVNDWSCFLMKYEHRAKTRTVGNL